jgi:hypothetical protein
MRTKTLNNAKLVVTVESIKGQQTINTMSVFDNRTNEFWNNERIKERGITSFLNIDDLKETLNWNLNGDSSKYQFKWGQTGKNSSDGIAYIFQ